MSDNVFDPQKYLIDIGTSLSDFEEVKLGDIAFSISGKGNFSYVEKMTSKKNSKVYAKKNSKVYAIKKLDKSKNKNSKNFIRETQISIELDIQI